MDFPSPAGVVDTLSGSAQLTGRVYASAPLAAFPAHPPDAGHRPLRPLFILRAVRRRWRLLVAVGAAGSLAAQIGRAHV